MEWQWWIGAAALLMAFEVASPGLFFLPFAVGCLAAPLVPWGLEGQLVTLAVIGLAGGFLLRPLVTGRKSQEQFGAQSLIGRVVEARAVDGVDGQKTFRVFLGGDSWPVVTDRGEKLSDGQLVRIRTVGGARLTVEPLEDKESSYSSGHLGE